jgi:hypothetical protein
MSAPLARDLMRWRHLRDDLNIRNPNTYTSMYIHTSLNSTVSIHEPHIVIAKCRKSKASSSGTGMLELHSSGIIPIIPICLRSTHHLSVHAELNSGSVPEISYNKLLMFPALQNHSCKYKKQTVSCPSEFVRLSNYPTNMCQCNPL